MTTAVTPTHAVAGWKAGCRCAECFRVAHDLVLLLRRRDIRSRRRR